MAEKARIVLSYSQARTEAHRQVFAGQENWPPSREEILEWLKLYIADPQAEVALVTIGEHHCQLTKGEALSVLDSASLIPTSRGLMSPGVIAVLAILEGVRAVSCHLGADVKSFLRAYNSGELIQLTSRRIAIIGEAMGIKGLSPYQVAQRAGLSPTATYGFLQSGLPITTQDLNRILEALGLTIEHLW